MRKLSAWVLSPEGEGPLLHDASRAFPPKLTEISLQPPPGVVARQLVCLEGGVVTVGHRLGSGTD